MEDLDKNEMELVGIKIQYLKWKNKLDGYNNLLDTEKGISEPEA